MKDGKNKVLLLLENAPRNLIFYTDETVLNDYKGKDVAIKKCRKMYVNV